MKTAKKILCLVLALLMALSICVTAFASLFPLNPESESSSSSASNKKYYWRIKYSPGSATVGSPFTEKYQYNPAKHLYVDIAFPEPEFANPEGLEFDYWEIWALDDEDMGIVDEKYSNKYRKGDGDFRVNGNYQFIAHWKSGTTKVTVTYSPGSGNGTAQSFQYNKNETIAIKKSKADLGFTKSGYVFAGWDINGKNYASGQAYQLGTNNVTITAKWNVYVPPESSSSVAPPAPSSSESVPESSSAPEESSQAEEQQQEETPAAFEPQNLAFNIAGDIPVTGIEYYITEDIGGTPSLWVTALTASTAEDPVTKKFITSGDALSAFDLSLLSDGSNYSGTSTGSITYKLNGTQTGKNSNYENRILALAHVVRADKYQGSTWYKANGNKAVLYNKETGETTEVKGLTFAEEDGVVRPVVSDVDMFKSFVYESSTGYLTEIKLAPDEGASYIAMDTTSLSPVLLVWVEKGEAGSSAAATSEGGIPVWVWIVIGAVILIVAVMVALYIAGKNSQKKSSDYRRERIEAAAQKKSSDDDDFHITGLDD